MPNNASPIDLFILFIVALLLLLLCAYVILRAAKKPIPNIIDAKSKIYAQQLTELEADLKEGRIAQTEFDAAKSEILRRILRHSNQEIKTINNINAPKLAIISIAFMAILAAGIYFYIGSPNLKDLPTFKREKEILSRAPESLSQNEILLVLQSRAQKDKKDPMPHLLMGKILLSQDRPSDALHAFQATLRRDNKNAEALAEIGGTIFALNGGKIDQEYLNALNAALQLDANNLSAKYYMGLGKWRNDDKKSALQIWQNAYEKIGNNEISKLGFLARIIDEISKLDSGPQMGEGGGQMMMGNDNPQEFIKSMLARREQKLQANPNDIGLRLSTARVLARSDYNKSQAILEEGLKIHKSSFESALVETAIKMNTKDGVK